jgi:hypothetical protein
MSKVEMQRFVAASWTVVRRSMRGVRQRTRTSQATRHCPRSQILDTINAQRGLLGSTGLYFDAAGAQAAGWGKK